ncbi:MAG: hypothetical protein CMM47_07415 [Rhodospirillaceae bacterium]|nr:hypothetical protein [Rhodospirillaceae bacterium]
MALKQTVRTIILVGVAGGVLLASYETFHWFTHVYEDDARIRSELTKISAQVDGKISEVLIEEGAQVTKGQTLIRLEDSDIRLGLGALRTDLQLKEAERTRLISEKRAFATELASKLQTQFQKIRAIEQEHLSIKGRLALSRKNLARIKFLLDKNLTSEDKFNTEQDKLLKLQGQSGLIEANIEVAKREYDQLKSTRTQIDVILEKIKISDLEQTRIKDDIRLQEVELGYRSIGSPIDGVVGRVHRYAGEYVEDGVTILMVHNPKHFWLEAYVDESQMRHVRSGQAVLIEFEAYPFEDYFGTVGRIGNVTTAEMGISTMSSGTGFGGGIERVPVRIRIDDPPPNLTPGMRARINIRIYERIKLW